VGSSSRPLSRVVREMYRREAIPAPVRWALAADGMHAWYAMLRKGLSEPMGKVAAEQAIAEAAALGYQRRYALLRAAHPSLPGDPEAPARILGALSLVARRPKQAWVFSALPGGAKVRKRDHLRAEWALRSIGYEARWREVTTHLGEILIQLTQALPKVLPGANAVMGRICFEGGRVTAERLKNAFDLPESPESAIEVLRMSEYVFRVNPEHWSSIDDAAHAGMLEGTACPWFTAPGWSMQHCGIFGQFQSGISSVFGLRYQLTTTIPKHGGSTCRIDLKPLKRKDGSVIAAGG
jgi:hypothetical protein